MNIGIERSCKTPKGFEPRQYEFECPCGYIWIDSENQPCPMCSNEVNITAIPYETKHPDNFGKRHD